MLAAVLGALSWDPQVKGGLYVVLAVLILCGSCYLLLATNTGARLGFQLAAAGLSGFMVIMGFVWWIYGIGPVGPSPTWVPQSVLTGDLGTRGGELRGFPKKWKKLAIDDKEVADAQPVFDGELTKSGGRFKDAADYIVVGGYQKGGETYGPLNINIRPLNVFHKPHYLVIQVKKVVEHEVAPGEPPPKPEADPAAPTESVVMLRDLGHKRLNPAVATISSAIIFGLLIYQLHTRDKEAIARKA